MVWPDLFQEISSKSVRRKTGLYFFKQACAALRQRAIPVEYMAQ
jgi:hypothetical protein